MSKDGIEPSSLVCKTRKLDLCSIWTGGNIWICTRSVCFADKNASNYTISPFITLLSMVINLGRLIW